MVTVAVSPHTSSSVTRNYPGQQFSHTAEL